MKNLFLFLSSFLKYVFIIYNKNFNKQFKTHFFVLFTSLFLIQSANADTEPNNSCTDAGSFHLLDAGETDSDWKYDYISETYNDYYRIVLTSDTLVRFRVEERSDGSRHTRMQLFTDNCTNELYDENQHNHDVTQSLNAGTYYVKVTRTYSTGINYRIRANEVSPLATNNPRPFTKVLVANLPHTNIAGDLLVIGNQSLCWMDGGTTCKKPGYTYSNNDYYQEHIDLDNTVYLNSTSANLSLNANDKVLEAWLYWIGRLDTNNETTRSSAQKIQLKTPSTSGYVPLTSDPTKFNWMVDGSIFDYGAAVNITQYVQQAGTYWVADLVATEMKNQGSGWAIAVIVEDTGTPNIRSTKNISLYDGFNGVYNSNPYPSTVESTISGFLTPSSGEVKSNIIVFAGESDRSLDDAMSLTKKDGTAVLLKDSLNDTNNMQNGTISRNGMNVTDRSPNYENTLGIDIDELNVSGIIENGQTSTIIQVDSYNDRIFLSMYGFATDLYIPEVCYDYTVQKNGFDITQDDRNISTVGTGELSITLALQSLEGDFDFINSQIGVRLVPTANTSFTEALYAPNNVNTLIPAIETASSTPLAPVIAIGEDATVTGGTIKSEQRYFSGFNYDLLGDYEGKFEVDLNTTIDFGSGAVPIWQSTQFNDVPRCPQSDYYNPIKGAYNIERTNSGNYNSITQPEYRYPLYTQVVGKDFDIHLVAYEEDPSPSFTQEIALIDYTVDIELINSSPFSDDQSVFVCNNPSPSIIQTLNVNTGAKNVFAKFPASPSTASSRVDLSGLDIITNTALRNAAFRIWYIVDKNNTILPHQCDQSDNTCFETLYTTHLKQDDVLDELPTPGVCSSYVSRIDTTKSGCYAYLRDFFSAAVCSRDNFSIRPASYRVKISDNNESLDPLDTVTELGKNTSAGTISVATLSAGYKYKLNGIATSYLSDTTIARGYNKSFASPFGDDVKSVLLFDTDLSKNSTTCFDKNNTDWGSSFDDGQIYSTYLDLVVPNNHVKHSNVGEYHYHIKDANWTLVDQDRYDFKTWDGVDDCIIDDSSIASSTTGMSGCTTDTEERTINGFDYRDLYLTFVPYKFNLANVGDVNHPDNAVNYTYFNDFDNSYYDDLTVHPIDMSMSFEGNISALGADDITLTNFTDTCKATPLVLTLLRRKVALPDEDALYDSKTNLVQLQQYLQHTSNLSPFVDKEIGVDRNITLPKDGFSDAVAQGQAEIFLHTTFKKPKNAVIDPFDITYETLEANGTALLQSSAHMGIHIPDGFQTYDRNITYYFTKVTPQEKIYEDVIVNFKVTAIYVDIYCSLGADCNTSFNLDTLTKGLDETSDWYYASIFDSITDGTTDLIPSTVAGVNASPSVSPNDDVVFDVPLDGTHNDIVVSVSGPGRPSTVEIEIRPVPWLLYDETNVDGYPHYQVDFIDNSGWSGVGNTGRVTGSKSSTESSPKMNW